MSRLPILLVAAVSLACLWGCSVIIDVPADCEDLDCRPYVCSEDKIQCLNMCASNAECGSGYVCEASSGACQPTGCLPQFPPVTLDGLPNGVNELAVSFGGAGGSDQQLVVLAATSGGLGFRRYFPDGALVPDDTDPDLGLIRLAFQNAARAQFIPVIRFVSSAEAASEGGDARFVMAWRAVNQDENLVEFGNFLVDPPQPPSALTSHSVRSIIQIEDIDFQPSGVGLLATWSERVGQVGEVVSVATDLSGRAVPGSAPELISPEDRISTQSTMLRSSEIFYVVFSTVGQGNRNVLAEAFDANNNLVGHLQLRENVAAINVQIEDIQGSSAENSAAVFWVENEGGNRSLYLSHFNDDVAELLDPGSTVLPAAVRIAERFSSLSQLTSADAPQGFIVAWIGERDGERDLWVQRLSEQGLVSYYPMALGLADAQKVPIYDVTSTRDGMAVVWQEETAEGAVHKYQRFRCAW